MTSREKSTLFFGGIMLAMVVTLVSFNSPKKSSAAQLNVPVYNASFFNTNGTSTACTVLSYTPGILHSLVMGTAGASGVVTLYDSSAGNVKAITFATSSIFVGPTSSATSTATGTIAFVLNGQILTTASVANGSSTTDAATAITTTIAASSTVLGVTATSSSNVVTITSLELGLVGNINLPTIAGQNGFVFYNSFNNSAGTQIIAQVTLPPTSTNYIAPETALYDSLFKQGLCIQETVATSGVTVSWQQN